MNSVDHILILTPGFPKDENDTTCIPALQVYVEALAEAHPSLRISVVSIQYPHKKGHYTWKGMPVYSAGGKNKSGFGRIFVWKRARKAMKAFHKANPVSIIHSFWMTEAAMLGHTSSFRMGVRHLNTLMGQDVLPSNSYLKILRTANLDAVAVSPFQDSVFQKSTGRDAYEVIPWGIKPPGSNNLGERKIHLLGVGSLIPLKQFHVLVEVAGLLKSEVPDFRVEIVGEGPERSKIEEMIAAKGLEGQVSLCGELPRAEVLAKMQDAQILLHPSEYESFGLVMAEALAQGMAVVSRPVGAATFGAGGPDAVAPSERWALARNPEDFAAAALGFLQQPPPTHPNHPFPIQATVDAYWKLYQS